MKLHNDQLKELVATQSLELPDGMTLRLRDEPDEFCTINEFSDCYGKVVFRDRNRYSGHGQNRPDDFDGRAEVVRTFSDEFWWQPPSDVTKEHLPTLRNTVREILDWGFKTLVLEICEDTDAYGKSIVRDYTMLGGIEPMLDDKYIMELLVDMVQDLGITVVVG